MTKKGIAIVLCVCIMTALCACGGSKQEAAYTPVDTDTVAVGAVVIARDDVPTEQIYAFVSNIFENIDAISHHARRFGSFWARLPRIGKSVFGRFIVSLYSCAI